jgi:hypothetical protein
MLFANEVARCHCPRIRVLHPRPDCHAHARGAEERTDAGKPRRPVGTIRHSAPGLVGPTAYPTGGARRPCQGGGRAARRGARSEHGARTSLLAGHRGIRRYPRHLPSALRSFGRGRHGPQQPVAELVQRENRVFRSIMRGRTQAPGCSRATSATAC